MTYSGQIVIRKQLDQERVTAHREPLWTYLSVPSVPEALDKLKQLNKCQIRHKNSFWRLGVMILASTDPPPSPPKPDAMGKVFEQARGRTLASRATPS